MCRGFPFAFHRTPPASQTDVCAPHGHRISHARDSASIESAHDRGSTRVRTACSRLAMDSCSPPGVDLIRNYMDYCHGSCYTEFTTGQSTRMPDMWAAYRA